MAHSIYRSPKGEQAIKSKYNDLLRHWPIEKKSIYLDTGCGRTHVIACGDEKNPPLVLLHGNSHCSIRWLNEVETYCSSHRVYAIDIIGEPNHSDQERPKVRSQQYLNWLEEIFAKLNLREAALVGENMGAWICLQFASTHPEKVRHLALLSPAGIVKTRWRFRLRRLLALLLGPWGTSLLMGRIAKGADIDPKMSDYHKWVRKQFKPRSVTVPLLTNKQLSQLYCPVFLLVGKKDVIFSARKSLLRLAHWVPQLEVNLRKADGHWLTTCTREIDRFLVTQYPAE